MQASARSDRAAWECGVRRVVSECSRVLLVAVKTAVTRWQPALRDDRGGTHLMTLGSTQLRSLALELRVTGLRRALPVLGRRLRCRHCCRRGVGIGGKTVILS
jgi:hypothetical protein